MRKLIASLVLFAGSLVAQYSPPSSGPAVTVVHSIGASFDGSGNALAAGVKTYITVPYACNIVAWDMTVDTGTATVDVWKMATGTAIPTVANTITAARVLPAIATGTALHSTAITTWAGYSSPGVPVAANDIFAFAVNAVAGSTKVSLVLQCQ